MHWYEDFAIFIHSNECYKRKMYLKNLADPDLAGNLHYAAKIITLRNRAR